MCWQNSLNEAVLRVCADSKSPRAAVLGTGSPMHSDDAAGVMIVRALKQNSVCSDRLLVINAGIALENVFGELQRFVPDLVLIIDAAQMGLEPGSVRLIDPRSATDYSFSTHTLPLQVLCEYLTIQMGSQITILGIQPADLSFGEELSPAVKYSLAAVMPVLIGILKPFLQTAVELKIQDCCSVREQSPGRLDRCLSVR